MALTPKQERFIEEYLIDLNATAAAKRAGYSQRTAHAIGRENLRKPGIANAIAKAKVKRAQKVEIDAQWVLRKLVELHETCIEQNDRKTTKGALDSIGKHVDVGAFDEKHTHEHKGDLNVVTGIDKGMNTEHGE